MEEMIVARAWRKSARCETAACVEIAFADDGVAVRDSKRSDGPILLFTQRAWDAFIGGAKAGEFDLDDGSAR